MLNPTMTKKKKILFLINNLGAGGAEKVLVNLVNHLPKDKFDITLRTLIDSGANKQFLSKDIQYESVFKNGFIGMNFLHFLPKKWIYKKVAHGQFDVIVVYLHGVLTKIVANAPASQKTIAYLHANMENSPFIKSFKSKEKLQKCFKSYDAIVSVSKDVEDSFKSVSGLTENLCVIYNTFDVKGIQQKAEERIDGRFLQTDSTKLCTVGTLSKVKGFDRLINICQRLKEDGHDFVLNIIGEGTERKYLEQLIVDNQLHEVVNLLGFQSNPYPYIANSDLFVSSSHSEGFSSVVVESVILQKPVITTNTSGMKEILGGKNEYGMVVENDEESLYKGLKELLQNKALLKHYSESVKIRSSYFSTERTVKEVEELLDAL